jgi:DNA-binding IclR family transcriptional regulator
MEVKAKKSIASVIKAVEILECIAESDEGLGVTEISTKLNLGTSSTYHILSTLRSCRMVTQNPHNRKYHIGHRLFQISSLAKGRNLMGALAAMYLERMRDEIQETANLAILDGHEVICVAQAESRHMLRMSTRPGMAGPFYNTAGGKLLVACQPRERWDSLISRVRFEPLTARTIVCVADLIRELEVTRDRGYGVDDEERELGVVCVAVPVCDSSGEAVAAMSVSIPTHRLQGAVSDIARRMRVFADEFSRELGDGGGEAPPGVDGPAN